MTYTVTAVGPDWVEIWDGTSIVDPDLPRHKSVDQVFVGEPNPFLVDDVVVLQVRLVARVIPPENVIPFLTEEQAAMASAVAEARAFDQDA